jgi:hypothetical protein
MPTITVSASGGTRNWSDTATWVGGVLPAVGDDIVANATSGDLYVNAINRTCLTINFTGFTNTFRIENGITLTVTGTSITLGSGMAYTQGTTGVLSTISNTAAVAIAFAGITIPRLTLGRIAGGQVQTVTISGTAPTVQNLIINNTASSAQTTLAGTALTITSSFSLASGLSTGTLLTFSGTCTISNAGSNLSNSITVASGSLQMLTNINKLGGTITFSAGTTLIPGLFTLILVGATTLNTSVVTWYRITAQVTGANHTLLSDLNISNDLNWTANQAFLNTANVNIGGSLIATGNLTLSSTVTINMTGTGTIETATGASIVNGNLNISGSGAYILGSVTRPTTSLSNINFRLVGTSVATVYSTTGHTLSITGGALSVINTNNTPTGNNVISGSEIIYGNLSGLSNQSTTITWPIEFLGNFSSTQNEFNGAKIFVNGNLSVTTSLRGTSTIELEGGTNTTWGTGTYQNNIIINKSSMATVIVTGNIVLGLAGRFLSINTNTLFGTSLITINGNNFTINNSSNSPFYDLTTNTANTVITLNNLITISRNLILANNTTFAGTHGFTTQNFTCTTAATIITLQNINANPLAEYIVNGVLTLLGTLANRITLQAAGSATFNGTITPVGQLNYLSETTPTVGMTVSQATGVSPVGLIGLLPNRPVITGGVSPTFTISPSATTVIGTSFSMRAGYKAKFTLTNGTGTQNVAYTTTQDIDSSSGITILSFGSNGDDINNSTISLFRTLNWGPLIAPSGSSYFTFVN